MTRAGVAGAVAAALMSVWAVPALAAGEIGVTSAVLPDARGTPPQLQTRVLQVGTGMFSNERIQTAANGKVHLLFQDGSALSVGPNSDIVLDTFVYDPATRTGELSMSATKGVFRFVGGRISKTTPVVLRTPQATIGIRGGVGIFNIAQTSRAALVFGQQMTVTTPTQQQVVNRAGFQVQILPNGSLTLPAAFTPESLNGELSQLEGTSDQTGETRNLVSENDIANSQLASLGSGLSPQVTGAGDPTNATAASALVGGSDLDGDIGVDEAQQEAAGESAGSGGGASGTGLVGKYRHSSARTKGTDIDASLDEFVNSGTLGGGMAMGTTTDTNSSVAFPVSTTLANDGSPGSGSFFTFSGAGGTSSPFGDIASGTSFVADSGEFAYIFADETNFTDHGVFIFLGVPTPAANIPSSGFAVYSAKRDLFLDGDLPFIASLDGGSILGTSPLDTGRIFVNWTPNSSGERAIAELTSLFSGLGSSQKSLTSVAVGRIIDDGIGKLHALGSVRTSARSSTSISSRTIYTTGPFSTLDGFSGDTNVANGPDFFGASAPDFFVLSSRSVSSMDVEALTGNGLTRRTGSTSSTIYDANVPATRLSGNGPAEDGTRISGSTTLKLEVAGIAMEFIGSTNLNRLVPVETDALTSNFITLNGDAGSLTANASFSAFDTMGGGSISNAQWTFGGNSSNSAFVSNDEFGAIENTAQINSGSVSSFGYFRSLDLRFKNLLSNVGLSPCNCTFLTAGFLGGQLTSGSNTYDFHNVPWVAGAPITAADFPTSGMATYTGNAVAQVFNVDSVYNAFGTFSASVSFSPGTVVLNDVDIVVDSANMNNMTGSVMTSNHVFVPFSGGTSTRFGDPLTTQGNARFAGDTGTLQNIYGHYVTSNSGGTYRQSGVFGAER